MLNPFSPAKQHDQPSGDPPPHLPGQEPPANGTAHRDSARPRPQTGHPHQDHGVRRRQTQSAQPADARRGPQAGDRRQGDNYRKERTSMRKSARTTNPIHEWDRDLADGAADLESRRRYRQGPRRRLATRSRTTTFRTSTTRRRFAQRCRPGETFTLELRAEGPSPEAIVRLRRGLKTLLRQHGLRCTSVTTSTPTNSPGATHGDRLARRREAMPTSPSPGPDHHSHERHQREAPGAPAQPAVGAGGRPERQRRTLAQPSGSGPHRQTKTS